MSFCSGDGASQLTSCLLFVLGSACNSNQGQIFVQMKWLCGSHSRELAEDKVKLA